MKRLSTILISSLIVIVLFSSCEDKKFRTYLANVPQYISYEDLRKSVEISDSRAIEQTGKIYFKDEYIYMNEYMTGVHVLDISDPTSPEKLAFIAVPGNVEMAIKDDILYLDSYTDLVLVDISDPANPVEDSRIEDILEYTLPEWDYDYPLAEIDEEKGVVTGYKIEKYKQQIYTNPYPIYWSYKEDSRSLLSSSSVSYSGGGESYGVAGSMARFLTYDDYLYMLESSNMLKVVDLESQDTPYVIQEKYVGWGLETMFIYDEHMYLGATGGLYILGLDDPEQPYLKSMYQHITSCDPVVVSGDIAYVTLRSGTRCGGDANLLEVIDISDKWDPERIASYGMTSPHGLGISGSTLFICENESGLGVYDASNPNTITSNKLAEFDDILATDVIPLDTLLFTIGDGGFYIYDYSDLNDITQIGSILIEGEE